MAPVRYYVATMTKDNETTRLGSLTAKDCLDGITSMRREGWRLTSLKRGTKEFELAALVKAAADEASPSAALRPA